MSSYSYSQQSDQQSQSSQSSSNPSVGHMAMANVQAPPKTLHEIFSMIADGYMQEAMHTAHIAADSFRKHQDNQSAQWAGKNLDDSQHVW